MTRMKTPQKDPNVRLEQAKHEATLQLLFRAARLLDEEALARLARADRPPLRRSHTALFLHIDLAGTRLIELARRTGVTKQAVAQLVDELEAWGVVDRRPDPEDRRAKLVVFSRRGRRGLLDGLALLQSLEAELAQRIGTRTMQGLRRALLAVLDDPMVKARAAAP